jgi:ABC-type uncharacterized transport system YnjBCD permease subunit
MDRMPSARRTWPSVRSTAAAAAVVLLGSIVAIVAIVLLYQRSVANELAARASLAQARDGDPRDPSGRALPADTLLTIAAGSFPLSRVTSAAEIRALTDSLESWGFHVYYSEVDNGPEGRWQRVLVGTYTSRDAAHTDADLLKRLTSSANFRVVNGAVAAGVDTTAGVGE